MKLVFNRDRCIGCRLCQLTCSASHEGVFNPQKARLRVVSDYLPEGGLLVEAAVCDLCGSCVSACPTGAMAPRDGRLALAEDLCSGCGECAAACQAGLIAMDDFGRPRFCDLCGGEPQCAAWCPHGALEVSAGE